jgi:LGFP repeat
MQSPNHPRQSDRSGRSDHPIFQGLIFRCLLCLSLLFPASATVHAQVAHTMANQRMEINATRCTIDVNIPIPLMNKLITQWNARQQSDVAGKIRVELWKVNYLPLAKDPNTIQIMLQNRVNTDISVIQSPDGVGYTMAAAPPGNDYAVLVYCDIPQSVPDLQIKGRPFYPNGNSNGLPLKKYLSNAKAMVNDTHIAFGIYSLTGPGSLSQLNFSFTSASAYPGGAQTRDFDFGGFVGDVVNGAVNVVNGGVNAVEGAASWVAGLANQVANTFNQLMQMLPQTTEIQLAEFLAAHVSDVTAIIAAAPKLIIDGVASAFVDLGNGFMALAIDGLNIVLYGNIPHVRMMNQFEYDWANAYMYNGNLPPISRLRITNLMSVDHRACTLPMPDGTIHLNLGDAYIDPIRFAKDYYSYSGQLFMHELGHAWQIGKYGVSPTVVNGLTTTLIGVTGGNAYAYANDCNDSWMHYNLEQQASIIDAGYALLYNNGSYFPGDKGSCKTETNDIVQNVRNGVPVSKEIIDNIFYSFLNNQYVVANTGGPSGILAHSNGTKEDGDGYYMVGHQPNTFFYYSSKLKTAAANWGVIRDKYTQATRQYSNGVFGAEYGYLGWPVNTVTAINGGLFQHFQHGSIYWNPKFGAYTVDGLILDAWAKQGWEKGSLGFPISDFISTNTAPAGSSTTFRANMTEPGQGYQKFEGGIIKYNGPLGANGTEVVLNSEMFKNNRDREIISMEGAGTGGNTGKSSGSKTSSGSIKPAPGVSQGINPQPLPPKIN